MKVFPVTMGGVLAGLLVLALASCSSETKAKWPTPDPFSPVPKVGAQDFNAWVYTPDFAKQYGMPEQWADKGLKGVDALAFRVEWLPMHVCGPGDHDPCPAPIWCRLDAFFTKPGPILKNTDPYNDYMRFYGLDAPSYLKPDKPLPSMNKRLGGEWVVFVHGGFDVKGNTQGGAVAVLGVSRSFSATLEVVRMEVPCSFPGKESPRKEVQLWVGSESKISYKHIFYNKKLPVEHKIIVPDEFTKRAFANYRDVQQPNTAWSIVKKKLADK